MFTIDDTTQYIFSPVCTYCIHWNGEPGIRTCKAFKKKIPDDIWTGANPHTSPVSGDNGVQFERFSPPIS